MKRLLLIGLSMAGCHPLPAETAGPAVPHGHCRFVGPETGQCGCPRFVQSDGYDGTCGNCSHPPWVHADYGSNARCKL
jgi:hypothetical protein